MFAGKKGEWNCFIFQFCNTARYFGWSQGEATNFIMSKPREVQDDYQALWEALEVLLGKMGHPTSARRQLRYLRQEGGESLEDYTDKVLTKVSEAYPGIDEEMDRTWPRKYFCEDVIS